MYPDPRSKSAQLHARARRVMPGGSSRATTFFEPYPVYAHHGLGCHVTDVDGVVRIDFVNNMSSLIHGHGHAHVQKAIHAQVGRLVAVAMPTEAEILLAEELCRRLPSVEQITFVNSGTEAVMIALRAARAYTGRHRIAKAEGAYHGAYDDAMVSVAPSSNERGDAEAPASVPDSAGLSPHVVDDVFVLPFNDVAATERLLRLHGETLAAVIVDPVVSRMGLVRATPDYLAMLRRVTLEFGIVLIFDEVLSFRLAHGGAQSYVGVEPDLTALGKVIGGGFPVGAVGGRREFMQVFDVTRSASALSHGGTYNANPMSMAAGRATLELLQPDEYERLAALGERARIGLSAAMKDAGLPDRAVAEGSLLFLFREAAEASDFRDFARDQSRSDKAAFYHRYMLNHGILATTFGGLILSTPMGEAEIDMLVERSAPCFREMAGIFR